MRTFHLEIVTPDGSAFDGAVVSLLVRTDSGDIEILAGHADFVGALAIGRARIRYEDGSERFASTSGGFITVTREGVKLVATTFEFADEIDVSRAKAAAERAERAISSAKDERDVKIAKAKLARATNRINVASIK